MRCLPRAEREAGPAGPGLSLQSPPLAVAHAASFLLSEPAGRSGALEWPPMRLVVTPEQMGAADRATIESGTPSLTLMERAGREVARAAVRVAGGAYGRRVVIVCGKGNNAGDGFVAARHLASWGAYPVVVLLDDPASLRGDARANLVRLHGIRTVRFEEAALRGELARASAAVDAIFGTGFRGAVEGAAATAVEAINGSGLPVVAVDIPSGVDGRTGGVAGPAVRAAVTVTMAALKVGLVLPPGSEHSGEVVVADIGIAEETVAAELRLVEEQDARRCFGMRPRTAHKRSVGVALVVAGSVGMSGAAALAAAAALRAGAGLVTVATPASVALEIDMTVLEATTLPLPETGRGTVEASAVDVVLARAAGVDAVALGPGLSTDLETVEFVRKLVLQLDRPLIVDADGLNALAGDLELLAAREAPTLITPHPGELGRLLGRSTAEVSADRLGAARQAAARSGAVVLLKGYRTVVAAPSGETVIVPAGGPALATGGTGDVLTGIAVALLAAGASPFVAAWTAAWIHGRAGDRLAERLGVRPVVAGDLLTALPEVIRRLEAAT